MQIESTKGPIRTSYGISVGEIVGGPIIAAAGGDAFLHGVSNLLGLDFSFLHTLPFVKDITQVIDELNSFGPAAEAITCISGGIIFGLGVALFADGALSLAKTRKVQKEINRGFDY